MARMPGTIFRGPVPYNSGDGDRTPMEAADALDEYRGVVVHIAAGTFDGTISWQHNDGANVSSHFVVAKDGTIAQLVDTHDRAWTQILGNRGWLSIENAAFLPEPLTAAQVDANARILAWAHQAHGIPLQLATSPAGRGLGHHSMGAESGINWGHSACPGEAIKAQKPAILARAIAIVNGDDMGFLDEKHPKLGITGGQMIADVWYALFKQSGTDRAPGSLTGELDAAAAADAADAVRDGQQLSKLDELLQRSASEMTEAQLVQLADLVAARLGTLRFVAAKLE